MQYQEVYLRLMLDLPENLIGENLSFIILKPKENFILRERKLKIIMFFQEIILELFSEILLTVMLSQEKNIFKQREKHLKKMRRKRKKKNLLGKLKEIQK